MSRQNPACDATCPNYSDDAPANLNSSLTKLEAENSHLLSVVTRLADQGYWSKRVTEASLRAILDEYVDYARGALALIKGDG